MSGGAGGGDCFDFVASASCLFGIVAGGFCGVDFDTGRGRRGDEPGRGRVWVGVSEDRHLDCLGSHHWAVPAGKRSGGTNRAGIALALRVEAGADGFFGERICAWDPGVF